MSGDAGRGENPDDWFGSSERGAVRPGSGSEHGLGEDDATREDWLDAGTEAPQAPPRQGLTRVRLWLVVAALVIALLIGLAAGGVFSGGSTPKITEPTTTATTPAQTTTGTGTGAKTTPSATAPTKTLAFGDKGEQVKKLQQALKQLGYYDGKVDGDYGPATKAAVEKFQQDAGLAVDGIVGPKTLSELQSRLANG
jgi:hypothetical protein